jgi:hypothetical protein
MRSKRFGSALLVMSATLATLGSLSVAGYCTGRNLDAGRRLLDPSRAPTSDEAALAYVADYSLQSNEANDVIFLGDSACRFDVDPIAIEQMVGLRAYNLGTFATAGPAVLSASGKSYLSHHPAPKLVVVCLSPLSLGFGSNLGPFTLPGRFAEFCEVSDRSTASRFSPSAELRSF